MSSDLKIDHYGNKRWYNFADDFHREDGPAIEYIGGHKYWFVNGRRHREDGPAIECASGNKEWWLNGERLTLVSLSKWGQNKNVF